MKDTYRTLRAFGAWYDKAGWSGGWYANISLEPKAIPRRVFLGRNAEEAIEKIQREGWKHDD